MTHSRQAAVFRKAPGQTLDDGAFLRTGRGSGAASVRAATEPRRRPSAVPTVPRGQAPEPSPALVDQVLRRPGSPLDAGTRSLMERRLGADFGHVRVHADERAAASAHALGAEAYTVGGSIVFASRRYAPDREEGRELLAHELVHTIQQDTGQQDTGQQDTGQQNPGQQDARGPAASGRGLGVEPQDSAAEGEARRIAAATRAGGPPPAAPGTRRAAPGIAPSRVPAGTIQCQQAPGRYRITQSTPLRELSTHAERFLLPSGTEVEVRDKGNRESSFRPPGLSFFKREHSYSSASRGTGTYNGWIDDGALERLALPAPAGPQGPDPRQDGRPPAALQPQPPAVQGVPPLWQARPGSPLEKALAGLGEAEAPLRRNGAAAPPSAENFAVMTVDRTGRTAENRSGGAEARKLERAKQPNLTLADKVYVNFGISALGTYSDFNNTVMQRISVVLLRASELGYHVEDEGLHRQIVQVAIRLTEEGHHSTVASSQADTGHVTFKDKA